MMRTDKHTAQQDKQHLIKKTDSKGYNLN